MYSILILINQKSSDFRVSCQIFNLELTSLLVIQPLKLYHMQKAFTNGQRHKQTHILLLLVSEVFLLESDVFECFESTKS